MASDEEVLQHFDLSLEYLSTSRDAYDRGYIAPALFNGIHALELAVKAILLTDVDEPIYTHNVGGKLGQGYRAQFGEDTCRKVNQILRQYNVPRYPGGDEIDP